MDQEWTWIWTWAWQFWTLFPIHLLLITSCSIFSYKIVFLYKFLQKFLRIMAEFDRKELILILTFWIFCPTLDMVTDMKMVVKLFSGPNPDLWVSGSKSLKMKEKKQIESFRNSLSWQLTSQWDNVKFGYKNTKGLQDGMNINIYNMKLIS